MCEKVSLIDVKIWFQHHCHATGTLLYILAFLYLGEINKDLWILVVTLLTVGTIFSIVNRSMTPESKVTWLLVTFIPVVGPLIYLMFGERRLSRKEMKQLRSMGFHEVSLRTIAMS